MLSACQLFLFVSTSLHLSVCSKNVGPFEVIVRNATTCEDSGTNQIRFLNFQFVENVFNPRTKKKDMPVFSYEMGNDFALTTKTQVSMDLLAMKTNGKVTARRLGGFCQMLSTYIPELYDNFLKANNINQCFIPKGEHKIHRLVMDVNPRFPALPYGMYRADLSLGTKKIDRAGCFGFIVQLVKKDD